jgi:hypothetical protein
MYSQYALLVVILYLIADHHRIHRTLDKGPMLLKNKIIRGGLLSVPIVTALCLDIVYGTYALKRMGLPSAWNKPLNKLLKTLGAYGMVQILAQDSGLKTGILQRDSLQAALYFVPVAVGMAFGLCENRSQAVFSVLLYYHLKYAVSNNVTSSVCFEDI